MAYQYYKTCGFVAQHSHAYRPDDEKRTRRGGESGNGFCFTGGDITFFAEIGYEFSSHGITAKHTHCEDITRRGRRAENFPDCERNGNFFLRRAQANSSRCHSTVCSSSLVFLAKAPAYSRNTPQYCRKSLSCPSSSNKISTPLSVCSSTRWKV